MISLIPAGQFVAIMGASGSGKSTLLGLLAGLDSPTEGEVLIDGIEISRLPEDKLAEVRGRKLGFVFQSFQLIPTLTALENVLLPHELNGGGNGRATAADLLRSVGLADRIHHYPIQLSGGEQQRVALARAFVIATAHHLCRRTHRQSRLRKRRPRTQSVARKKSHQRRDPGAGNPRCASLVPRRSPRRSARRHDRRRHHAKAGLTWARIKNPR